MSKSWEELVAHVKAIPQGDYETYDPEIGWDNNTRFGRQYGENGVAWCVIFDWCMYADVGMQSIVPKTDNVTNFSQWAKARGQWSEYPSIGAWMNWRDGEHTEIVVSFTDTHVTTIGGNTIPAGGDGGQGRGVYEHTWRRTDPRVTGYFAPRFADGCPPTADPHDYRKAVTPDPPSTPNPSTGGTRMALISKTVPNIAGDESATTFTAVPGAAWLNVSADYVQPGEKVTLRIDVSDGSGKWVQNNEIRELGNGEAGWLRLAAEGATRVVSVKRLDHAAARVDATLHYPEG